MPGLLRRFEISDRFNEMQTIKYNREDEEVIGKNMAFPYNILPKGYPNKISDDKLKETINILLNQVRGNAGVVGLDVLVNLGLNELNYRVEDRKFLATIWISLVSLIFAGLSFFISILSIYKKLI